MFHDYFPLWVFLVPLAASLTIWLFERLAGAVGPRSLIEYEWVKREKR